MQDYYPNKNLLIKGEDITKRCFIPFVINQLISVHGNDCWQTAVLDVLPETTSKDLPDLCDWGTLDISKCIKLVLSQTHWNTVFRPLLPHNAFELLQIMEHARNRHSHAGFHDISVSELRYFLSAMIGIMSILDRGAAAKIKNLSELAQANSLSEMLGSAQDYQNYQITKCKRSENRSVDPTAIILLLFCLIPLSFIIVPFVIGAAFFIWFGFIEPLFC